MLIGEIPGRVVQPHAAARQARSRRCRQADAGFQRVGLALVAARAIRIRLGWPGKAERANERNENDPRL